MFCCLRKCWCESQCCCRCPREEKKEEKCHCHCCCKCHKEERKEEKCDCHEERPEGPREGCGCPFEQTHEGCGCGK